MAEQLEERCNADLVCVEVRKDRGVSLRLSVTTEKPLSFGLFFTENLAQLNPEIRQLAGAESAELASFPAPAEPWGFFYRIHYGYEAHEHDEEAVYLLPFALGAAYSVNQSHTNISTHRDGNRYAIDWGMPVGEAVYAAREGVVVTTYADSAGHSASGEASANHIWIRHPDGTIGKYVHLAQGGVLVREGQRVCAGERIGTSGNTGYSSGAHLHFSVSTLGGDVLYRTFNVRFLTEAGVEFLVGGQTYRRVH